MDQAIGQWHHVFFHFPIILFTAALICDLLYGIGKEKPLAIGHWFIIGGVLMCIPTIVTGEMAAKEFNLNDVYLEKHRFLGFATAIGGSLYSGLRIAVMLWNIKIPSVFYVGLSVLLVALISWTSDYGALIPSKEDIKASTKPSNQADLSK